MNELSVWLEKDYIKALIVLVVAFLLIFVVRLIIRKIFWRLAEKTETDLDDEFLRTFQFPVSASLFTGGLWLSLSYLTYFKEARNPALINLIGGVLATVAIMIWMTAFLSFSGFLVDWLSESKERFKLIQPRTKPLFQMLIKTLVVVCAIYFVILAWGQDVTGWLASAGVAGIAIGFAAKDTLANFIAGIFIVADSPYKIGDYILLGNGDRGRVTDIGMRSTRLLTRDDVEIIIPNAIIGNTEIINQSGGPIESFRIRIKLSVAYGSDVDLVREVAMEVATSETLVLEDPKPRLRFRSFGDSGLDYELLVWVRKPEMRGQVMDVLLTRIYKAFGQKNIEIPYPKRDVYLHHVPTPDKVRSEAPQETDPSV